MCFMKREIMGDLVDVEKVNRLFEVCGRCPTDFSRRLDHLAMDRRPAPFCALNHVPMLPPNMPGHVIANVQLFLIENPSVATGKPLHMLHRFPLSRGTMTYSKS